MRGPIVALSLLLAAAPSCSVILNTTADQCDSDADCAAKGAGFENNVCGPQKTCVFACQKNHDCIDKLGVEAICHKDDRTCAPLKSQDCLTLHMEPGDLDRDPVILGILLPVTGENAKSMVPPENAVELARRDIQQAAEGLPPITAGGKPRPLVFLTCTDADDPIRAARHLSEVVRVPAIIGPAFSGVTTSVAKEVTIPDKVLIMSPSATSPTLTDLADDGLVWRTCPSDVFQSVAMSGLVEKFVEQEIRTTYMLAASDDIRLAVVHKGDAYGAGLASALFKGLRFNGKSAAANGSDLFLQIDYGDPSKLSDVDQKARRADAVKQLLAFRPHILIEIGTAEAVTDIFSPVEMGWPGSEPIRPRHVVSDGMQIPEIVTAINGNDALRKRVFGTIAGTTGGNFELFRNAYNVAFKDGSTPDSYAASAYDGAYLLAFAIAGVGNGKLDGKAIDAALHKVVNKRIPINVGQMDLSAGYKAMALDGIDFNGASGPLDFDVTKGEAPADIQVWCVDNKGGFKYTGLFYDAAKSQIAGTLSCP
jgi:branched-chain amino acid transport system substrate-binding protein